MSTTPIIIPPGTVYTVAGEELYNPFPQQIHFYKPGTCDTCNGSHAVVCSVCKGDGCDACDGGDVEPCPTCNPEGELMSAAVHGRGVPGYPEPTLCGDVGPVPHVVGAITCPRCNHIAGNPAALARRAEKLREQYGQPQEGARC